VKTINITVTLTDTEYDFLKLGKCDIPSPQRLKMMLLREAARNLRNMSESVLQSAVPYEDQRYMKTAGKDKPSRKYSHLPAKTERAMTDYEREAVSAVLAKPKPKRASKEPLPEWLHQKNIAKLRDAGVLRKPSLHKKPNPSDYSARVLTNNKADAEVPYTETPLEDFKF
jgi:hypothetical protein